MNLVVAVDGSDESERALAYAVDVVDRLDGRLTLVHVVDPDLTVDTASEPISDLPDAANLLVSTVEEAEERGAAVLEEAADVAADRGVDAETELLYGDPVTEIADLAKGADVDGVVVGHRGLSGKAERMMGSVAKGLVERAPVAVTVVP